MKYLTKKWYELCQQTGLHYGMRVHNAAHQYNEELYQRLYKRNEKKYVDQQREFYDYDPRMLLEVDVMNVVPLQKVIDSEEIADEDVIVHQISIEERTRVEERIAEYDARPPFDEIDCKQAFSEQLEWKIRQAAAQLPPELLSQIADMRIFVLGYCTKAVYQQLKKLSIENRKKVEQLMEEAVNVMRAQHIPETRSFKLNFHDCKVVRMDVGERLVIRFDTARGFTKDNKVTFFEPRILLREEGIVESHWLYHEIYRIDEGYEVHVLLSGKKLCELILWCKDIEIEEDWD